MKLIENYSILILSTFFILSCNESKVEDVNYKAGHATFTNSSVELVSMETYASNQIWPDIKDRAIVNLKTCLQDTTYVQAIYGEEFIVSSNNSKKKETSNGSGCISWSEEFSFNYLNDETYYTINGEIIGSGNQKGSTSFSIAINPWSNSVKDLKQSKTREVRSISDANQNFNHSSNLAIDKIGVNILERKYDQNGASLKVELTLHPELLRKNINNGTLREKLSNGKFQLESFLIDKNSDDDTRVVLAHSSDEINVQPDGKIRKIVYYDMYEGVRSNSVLELGVKLVAIDSNVNIGSDVGTVNLKHLEGNTTYDVSTLNMSFDYILKSQKERNINIKDQEFGFIIDKIMIVPKSEGLSNQDNKSMEREVAAQFSISMVDSLMKTGIINHPFLVEVKDIESNITLFSDEVSTSYGSKTLDFRVNIPFQSYSKIRWKNYRVRITSERSPYSDLLKERIVHINPWLKSSDFGIDSKNGTPPKVNDDLTPEIYLKQFSYTFAGNAEDSFKLNKSLDLVFERTFDLEFEPTIKVNHDFEGKDLGDKKLMNGNYRVRFLVLAPKTPMDVDYTKKVDLDDFQILTGDEQIVEARNGHISHKFNLPLSFTDQMYFSLKNIALVEISSIDKDVEIRPGYFLGTIVGANKDGVVKRQTPSGHYLSTGSINIAKRLVRELGSIKNKLQKDSSIGDNFKLFTQTFKTLKQKAPAFNGEKLDVSVVEVDSKVFSDESIFKKTYNLKSSKDDIKSLVTNFKNISTELSNELCDIFYNKNDSYTQNFYSTAQFSSGPQKLMTKGFEYKNCIKDINNYLTFSKFYHVDEIMEHPTNVNVETLNLDKSVAYFVSRGQTFSDMKGVRESDYLQYGWTAHIGLEGGKFGFFGGANVGAAGGHRTDIFTSKHMAEMVSNQKRLINQDGTKFEYDKFNMRFVAKAKACVLISGKLHDIELPKRNIRSFDFSDSVFKQASSAKQIYLCKENLEEKSFLEKWYFARIVKKSSIADESLLKNTTVNIIRGEKNFDIYRQTQIDSDKQLVFIEYNDEKDISNTYKNYLEKKGKNLTYKEKQGVGFPSLIEVDSNTRD